MLELLSHSLILEENWKTLTKDSVYSFADDGYWVNKVDSETGVVYSYWHKENGESRDPVIFDLKDL